MLFRSPWNVSPQISAALPASPSDLSAGLYAQSAFRSGDNCSRKARPSIRTLQTISCWGLRSSDVVLSGSSRISCNCHRGSRLSCPARYYLSNRFLRWLFAEFPVELSCEFVAHVWFWFPLLHVSDDVHHAFVLSKLLVLLLLDHVLSVWQ